MFLFIIAIGILLGTVIGVVVAVTDGSKGGAAVIAVIGTVAFITAMILSCTAMVPTGHTGIVVTFGRVESSVLDSGLSLVLPWQDVITMDNRIQKQESELSCFSSDIQEVSMKYTVNYQIKKSDAMTIYATIGQDYYNTVIVPCITESVKTVVARYSAEQLVGMRDELAAEIEADLAAKLLTYNIELVSTSVEDMDFTDAFTQAVEAKQVAQQNKLKAETEAEQRVIEAEAAAEVRRVEADAQAYELLTKAEAEAEANRKVAESLTDELIAYTYACLWDGELPMIMSDGSALPILSVGQTEAEAE